MCVSMCVCVCVCVCVYMLLLVMVLYLAFTEEIHYIYDLNSQIKNIVKEPTQSIEGSQ